MVKLDSLFGRGSQDEVALEPQRGETLQRPENGARSEDQELKAIPASKKLILHGFHIQRPDPSYIAANAAYIDSLPIDGLAIYLSRAVGQTVYSSRIMTNTPVSEQELSALLQPIRNSTLSAKANSFALVFSNRPADPFDDWSVAIENFRKLARVVKAAGLRGIFFDNEEYFEHWTNYPDNSALPWSQSNSLRYAHSKSLEDYENQARLRGRQIMEAITDEFSEAAIIVLHGPYVSVPAKPTRLFRNLHFANELKGAFFAGLVEGKGPNAAVVDGGEMYNLRTESEFAESYQWRKNTIAQRASFIPAHVAEVWPERTSIAFGVYDRPFQGKPMNPTVLRSTIANAMKAADEFVWFYTETFSLIRRGGSGAASPAWVDGLRQGRSEGLAVAPLTVSPGTFAAKSLVSPDSYAAAFAPNLASETHVDSSFPVKLAGVAVRVRDSAGVDRQARLYAVAAGQVNFLIPEQTASGGAWVRVIRDGVEVAAGAVMIAPVAPTLFSANGTGQGLAAANALLVGADGSKTLQSVAAVDERGNVVAQPIVLGGNGGQVFLSLFGTGIRNFTSAEPMRLIVGGVNCLLQFVGPSPEFPGLDQVNALLDRSLAGSGEVDIHLIVDGIAANIVRISIH
jgi:uncharacterized protein (TIGR03437 family)